MTTTPDKYDIAIEYLTEHPDKIHETWDNPMGTDAGCLFQFCTKDGTLDYTLIDGESQECGCLTQVRRFSDRVAWTPELTEAIKRDDRIPELPEMITVFDLPVFAEWQRRLDKEIRGVKETNETI